MNPWLKKANHIGYSHDYYQNPTRSLRSIFLSFDGNRPDINETIKKVITTKAKNEKFTASGNPYCDIQHRTFDGSGIAGFMKIVF